MQYKDRIVKVNIEHQMKSAYIDYSMSVIVSRALPDIRDGLKPVHRRVLFGMRELALWHNKPYKKSARIVGEVLGKYHPHGDSSVYDAMVRMAQYWSLRYPFVDGQGNFGSIDGDSPAAMRYTEAKLQRIAEEMLIDIDKDTVDFKLNFDDTIEEPSVLPAGIPNLLVNGASGIAVGMATNIPPHNINEVIDAIVAYINNNDITTAELMKHIKGPDFPTGGIIYGYEGVREAYETGRGKIVMRGAAEIEMSENGGRDKIIVTSIPYQVNKAEMIKKTADLVNEKKIDGVVDIRDESDRNGLRIVYELKKDAIPNVVLNKLYQMTWLQSSFSVNSIALVKGRPMMLNLKQMIHYFVEHRHEVLIRKTGYELKEAEEKAHILEGLLISLDHLDEVITLIRASQTPEDAKNGLISKFNLSDIQARAILDMRLQRLTGLEREKVKNEYEQLLKHIEYLKQLLTDRDEQFRVIKNDLIAIKEKYGDPTRTEIEHGAEDFKIEDIIPDEEVVVTISHLGYIKRTNLAEYRTQNRGGVGAKGSDIRTDDFVEHMFVATNHNYLLLFTEKGKCFWLRVFEIPEGTKSSKGRAIQNMINIEPGDKVKAYINILDLKDENYVKNNFIILASEKGLIKKTSLEAYSRPRQNGINAINIREDDHLLEARLTNGNSEVILALKSGRAIRFNEKHVRAMGRNATGVKGITVQNPDDKVIGMICMDNDQYDILVVSENGYGKRSKLEDYRITSRGGKGIKTMNITEKTGQLVAVLNVNDNDDLMIINKSGIAIRLVVNSLRVMGRATQGVKLINLKNNDAIAAVTKIAHVEDESNTVSIDDNFDDNFKEDDENSAADLIEPDNT